MPLPDVCVTERGNESGGPGIPVFSLPADGRKTFEFVIREAYDPQSPSVSLTSASSALFTAKEMLGDEVTYINKTMTIVDAENGQVSVTLRARDVPFAGIWYAGIALLDADGEVVGYTKAWLNVEKTSRHLIRENTPLSIVEIRTFLRDRVPSDNFLLDDVQFSDSDIAAAITWPVDEWNETPPPVSTYTPATFPHRRHWMIAAAAHLLRTAAYNYARNQLSYNAGGSSVDDKNKQGVYMQLSKDLEAEWKNWMLAKKIEENVTLAYGGVGAQEFNGRRGRYLGYY
jgi:hypothetical protein